MMLGFVKYLIEHTPVIAIGHKPKKAPKPREPKTPTGSADYAALRAAELKRMQRATKALKLTERGKK